MMRLLFVSLAVSVFAQPALAREHSRHHHLNSAAHSHHWSAARHRVGGWSYARRARAGAVLAYGGGFDGRQSEMYAVPGQYVVRPQFEPQPPRQVTRATQPLGEGSHGGLDSLIARHAQLNGVPESLVHRVVIRESRYNARAVGRGGAMGLMQIKYSTARAMGYTGSPAGLLDPDTNLTYAVRYLAGAYRVAGGDSGRSVSNYARGYYAGAKRQGFSPYQGGDSYASAQTTSEGGVVITRRHFRRGG
jgi:soluble lytic murein transglycosylase-like protein